MLNNPLLYTDPSGEFIFTALALIIPGAQVLLPFAIAADIGGIVNLTSNAMSGNLSGHGFWGGLGRGLAAYGSGAGAGALSLFGPAGWAGGGALVGGTNAALSGDNVWEGIGIGAATSLVGGQLGKWAANLGTVAVNGVTTNSPLIKSLIGGVIGGALGSGGTTFAIAMASGASFEEAMAAAWESSKSGAVFGAISGVGAGYIQSKANKVDFLSGEKLQLHHSDPKFMGGDPKQTLTPLSESLHKDLHRDLNDFLKLQTDDFGNHMRPQRGNSSIKIQEIFPRSIRIETMKSFYNSNRFIYPRSRYDFYKNNGIKWRL